MAKSVDKSEALIILSTIISLVTLVDGYINFERPWQETAIKISIAIITILITIAILGIKRHKKTGFPFPFIPIKYYKILIITLCIVVGTLATALIIIGVANLQLLPLIMQLPIGQANIILLAAIFSSSVIVGVFMFSIVFLSLRAMRNKNPSFSKKIAKQLEAK